jgi:adenylate kinase family enzyme
MNILVFGLPGSGKTTLANKLSKKIGATHLNADDIREKFQD